MYKVYWMLPKQHPVFVAEFESEQYAQILVDTGNKLYEDGREFWAEQENEINDDIDSYKQDDDLELALFDRTEARAINWRLK